MRAILLAAGFGTRLRPLTDSTPKCLVPIKGKPLLHIWLERLAEAGIGPYMVNTHYLSDQVNDYVNKSDFRERISLVHEPILLGTAGTLIANLSFFNGEDGLLIHADNYCLADLRAFILAHKQRPRECIMTMMTFRCDDPTSCGIVSLNEGGVVVNFHEKIKMPPGNLANGAVYILSAEFLRRIDQELPGAQDFSTEVINYFLGEIYSYETTETFVDIGQPVAYSSVNK
jgi:mannose-1-phosphate guanylyltransferase